MEADGKLLATTGVDYKESQLGCLACPACHEVLKAWTIGEESRVNICCERTIILVRSTKFEATVVEPEPPVEEDTNGA